MANKINIKEFREKGYLQELNRKFLHPLGMALIIRINDDGSESLDSILDSRDDAEGFIYDTISLLPEEVSDMRKKRDEVDAEWNKKAEYRTNSFGYVIEPVS